jgi:hypothetical protein
MNRRDDIRLLFGSAKWFIGVAGFCVIPAIMTLFTADGPHPAGFGWASNSIEHHMYSAYGIGVYRGVVSFGSCRETWSAVDVPPQIWCATGRAGERDSGLFFDGRLGVGRGTSSYVRYSVRRSIDNYIFTTSGFMFSAYLVALVLLSPAFLIGLRLIIVARRKSRGRSRLLNDLCTGCGYDLRAGPGKICPECGTIPPGGQN